MQKCILCPLWDFEQYIIMYALREKLYVLF